MIATATFSLLAGSALAQMQPIPNPPETKQATTTHHARHHKKHHKAHRAAAAKPAPKPMAQTSPAKPAMPPGPVNPMPPKK